MHASLALPMQLCDLLGAGSRRYDTGLLLTGLMLKGFFMAQKRALWKLCSRPPIAVQVSGVSTT